MKTDLFIDISPYNPVHFIVRKIRYMFFQRVKVTKTEKHYCNVLNELNPDM